MTEDKTGRAEPESSNIEEILRQRERLERILQEKYRKEVTILFSDICNYTEYIDARGDVNGRALLFKHNRVVLPQIEKHGGRVIEIVGDAVMAAFSAPLSAVKASMAVQQALNEHNLKTNPEDRISVRVGINLGEVLVDDAAVYQGFSGDVANVASRVQSQAGPGQILISKATYERVCGSDDILSRFHGTVRVKGKAEALEIYRVLWRDEDVVVGAEPKRRLHEPLAGKKVRKPLKVLQLEVNRDRDRLQISAHERITGEESAIRHYEKMPVSMDWIEARCREITDTLNRTNRHGRLTREVLVQLREVGQVFYDELFTIGVKGKLQESKAEYLSLNLDDHLVHIPWELLHDGRQFLCQRFNMGRLVRTKQTVFPSRSRELARPLRMLILADPAGDLEGAYSEGTQIRDMMDRDKDLINVSLRSGNITPGFLKEKIRNFDLVHFAGHADYNPQSPEKSGWRLTEGSLSAQDVIKMAGTATMPVLIFSNACQSARTEVWALRENFQSEIFGLANAFLLAGVKHYVGTFWEILDEPSGRFALEFYSRLLAGSTAGAAMRLSRQELIRTYGEETIVWASYLLYGDPTSSYLDEIRVTAAPDGPELDRAFAADAGVRTREEVIDFAGQEVPRKTRKSWWALVIAALMLAAVLGLGYSYLSKKQTVKYEDTALTYYQEGNFEKALRACDALEEKSPASCLAYLIRGNIYLRRGKLEAAEGAYQKALRAARGSDSQKAEVLVGLGRVASLRNQPEAALEYYRKATGAAPRDRSGYLSQALVLEGGGKYAEALDLLVRTRNLAPQDHVLAALTSETREKAVLARDQEKQKRIDRMVEELLEGMKSPPRAVPSDGWTSLPLTMWIMEFRAQGYSLQEGEERLLVSAIADQVLQQSRIQLVERALLDKLLQELKLGASEMIDRSTALSLGKILAARLILSGQVLYAEAQSQVSLRLIETETGRISATVNESFGSAVPVSVMSDKLSKNLLAKLKRLYPLRGKIADVKDNEVRLNIGVKAGVRVGQQFKTVDQELIFEVVDTGPEASLARLVKGEGSSQKGARVEAL